MQNGHYKRLKSQVMLQIGRFHLYWTLVIIVSCYLLLFIDTSDRTH